MKNSLHKNVFVHLVGFVLLMFGRLPKVLKALNIFWLTALVKSLSSSVDSGVSGWLLYGVRGVCAVRQRRVLLVRQ